MSSDARRKQLGVVDRDGGEPAVFAEELDRRCQVRLHGLHSAPAAPHVVEDRHLGLLGRHGQAAHARSEEVRSALMRGPTGLLLLSLDVPARNHDACAR